VKFISGLKESDRESVFKKNYMKIFALSIILLIVGIIIASIGRIYSINVDIDTSEEYENYIKTMGTIFTLTGLTLQLGIVLFSLSTFMGAAVDKTLSGEVRRGMVFASSMAIIGLVLLMMFQGIFIM